jgi:hypothetical protein
VLKFPLIINNIVQFIHTLVMEIKRLLTRTAIMHGVSSPYGREIKSNILLSNQLFSKKKKITFALEALAALS